jgi:hypothetical protein
MAEIVLVLQIYISGSRNRAVERPIKEKITVSCMKITAYTYTHKERGL